MNREMPLYAPVLTLIAAFTATAQTADPVRPTPPPPAAPVLILIPRIFAPPTTIRLLGDRHEPGDASVRACTNLY